MDNSSLLDGEVARQISAHDLISLDVFDTLILRAVSRPADVFALVKLRLMTHPETLLSPEPVDCFPALRIEAERLARIAKQQTQGTPEVSFEEVYEQLALLSRANARCLALLQQTELDLEASLVYPNPVARQIWLAALEQQKKVVFCSDMYLPSSVVTRLLEKCGYCRCDGLYVSCEHARSKREGTFLGLIAGKHGVPLDRVLHIGDNGYSDYTMARQAGCTAIHLPRPPVAAQVTIPCGAERPFYTNTVFATIQGVVRRRAVTCPPTSADPWERAGYEVFGPLFTGFLLWLTAIIERNRPQKILLFARDTQFLHQHLARFLHPLGLDADVDYLYVSRGSLLLPSLTDFPLSRLWHLFSGKSHISVAAHLRRMGLSAELLANTVVSSGFESLSDIVPNGEPRMHALLTKLFEPLLREAARRRPLAGRYLTGAVGEARRLMLVDIGWVGNMQASFLRLLEPLTGELQVRGYYIGLYGYARENDYPPHTMEGWLTHYGDPPEMEKDVWWAGGTELLEFAMCAPHGTTLAYRLTETGEVAPVLETSAEDAGAREFSGRIQKGAGRFLEEYLDSYRGMPAAALVSRVWANEFHRLVTAPTLEEAELFGDLTHSDSAGDTGRRIPLAPRIRTTSPQEISQAWKQSFWKAGFQIRNGLAGSPV